MLLIVFALVISPITASAANMGMGSDSSWAPPISAFRSTGDDPNVVEVSRPADTRPGGRSAILLLVGTSGKKSRPNIDKAFEQLRSKDIVIRWNPGSSLTSVLDSAEIHVAGNADEATQAMKSIIRLSLRIGDPKEPIVVRYLLDSLYGLQHTLEDSLQDPPGFFVRFMIPDWLPSEGELWTGKTLLMEVLDHGKPYRTLTYGNGPVQVRIQFDLTDLASLQSAKAGPSLETAKPRLENKGKPLNLPGTPLDSALDPGIWFGQGDRGYQGIRGTVLQNQGRLVYGDLQMRIPNDEATAGGKPDDQTGYMDLHHESFGGQSLSMVEAGFMGKTHGGSFRYYQSGSPNLTNNLLRAAYMNRLHWGGLRNDFTGKFGYLYNSQTGSSDEGDSQLLLGLENTLSYAADLGWARFVTELGGGAVFARQFNENTLDHSTLNGGVEAVIPIRSDLHLMGQYKHRLLNFNTDRYFFADQKTDDQTLGALAYTRGKFQAGLLGGVHVTRGSQSDDVRKQAGAWVTAFNTTLTGLAVNGDWLQEQTIALSQKVSRDWNLEAYYSHERSTHGTYENRYAGVGFSYGFGGGGPPDARRYQRRRDDPYAERFYQDYNLPQSDFADRMDSVRKLNEWTGSNLTYKKGSEGKWSRYPGETYGERGGDCDEQAWLVSRTLNDNPDFRDRGGKAYILDYWTNGSGHGVSLVEEGGKVFLNEYGRNYRVNVDPNASLETKARAALEQLGPYLALRPSEGGRVSYKVFGTDKDSSNRGYDYGYYTDGKTRMISTNDYHSTTSRPPIEHGIGTLIGLDAF